MSLPTAYERSAELLTERLARRASADGRLQPRYDPNDPRHKDKNTHALFIGQVLNLATKIIYEEPEYKPDSRKRDRWLGQVWRVEPLTQGVVFSMVERDKNRGWSLTGPLSTVRNTKEMLHMAEGGAGWREHVNLLATSYYASDIGALPQWYRGTAQTVVEDDYTIQVPPLKAIFSYDPTRCKLTSNWQTPLRYYPPNILTVFSTRTTGKGKKRRPKQESEPYDLILGNVGRFCSMREVREEYNGLGWCFMSRVTTLIRLLVAVLGSYQESLENRAPQGFLLLDGISQQQFVDLMGGYEAALDRLKQQFFGGTFVIANEGIRPTKAEFVRVSQAPDGFDLTDFVELVMKGMALAAGYPVDEFWSIQSNSFGRGRETEVIDRRAGGKGRNAFANAHQEQLQRPGVLSKRVHFEYEKHDAQDRVSSATVAQEWLKAGELALKVGMPAEAVLSWMVDEGILPPRATDAVEDSVVTDTSDIQKSDLATTVAGTERAIGRRSLQRQRQQVLENPDLYDKLHDASAEGEGDPVVRYTYSIDANGWDEQRQIVLWDSPKEALRPSHYPTATAEVAQLVMTINGRGNGSGYDGEEAQRYYDTEQSGPP